MDLESLLKANLELQKRIATDRKLRHHMARLWNDSPASPPPPQQQLSSQNPQPSPPQPVENGVRELTFRFPVEMCELLAREVERTGKTPDQILEDCFAEYYLREHGQPGAAQSESSS